MGVGSEGSACVRSGKDHESEKREARCEPGPAFLPPTSTAQLPPRPPLTQMAKPSEWRQGQDMGMGEGKGEDKGSACIWEFTMGGADLTT